MMNANDLKVILRDLAAAFPGTAVSSDMAELWAKYLSDQPVDIGKEAADTWIRARNEFPSVSDFRAACGQVARLRRQEKITDEVISTAPRDRFGERNVEAVRDALEAALRHDADGAALPVLTVAPPLPKRGHGCISGYTENANGAMIPCRVCNYPAYERWASGEYRSRRVIPG